MLNGGRMEKIFHYFNRSSDRQKREMQKKFRNSKSKQNWPAASRFQSTPPCFNFKFAFQSCFLSHSLSRFRQLQKRREFMYAIEKKELSAVCECVGRTRMRIREIAMVLLLCSLAGLLLVPSCSESYFGFVYSNAFMTVMYADAFKAFN